MKQRDHYETKGISGKENVRFSYSASPMVLWRLRGSELRNFLVAYALDCLLYIFSFSLSFSLETWVLTTPSILFLF